MGKIIVEQIISADGYAADANGGIGFFRATSTLGIGSIVGGRTPIRDVRA